MSENTDRDLVLYMIPGSYFSLMALLTLHETGLGIKPHFVNLYKYEQYEPWFLKLNPKGQVPVLQHGEKVVPGSDQIFLYLDKISFIGGFSSLLPAKGTEALRKVEKFDGLFRTIRNATLTFGIIRFPQLSNGIFVPDYEQKARIRAMQNKEDLLKDLTDRFPEVCGFVSEKCAQHKDLKDSCQSIEDVKKEITSVGDILEQVELELASHNGDMADWWLCSDQFTSADVILAIILHRLDLLGLSSSLLLSETRPCLLAYKAKLGQRPTFKAFLSHLEHLHKQFESNLF